VFTSLLRWGHLDLYPLRQKVGEDL
jgi:hypothetical protein